MNMHCACNEKYNMKLFVYVVKFSRHLTDYFEQYFIVTMTFDNPVFVKHRLTKRKQKFI